TDGPALVVSIAQDPGGTTPEKTSRLCVVCNSANRTDQSAIHAFDLWRAAISQIPQTHPYHDQFMRRTYFTNALLHGVPTQDARSERSTGFTPARLAQTEWPLQSLHGSSHRWTTSNSSYADKSMRCRLLKKR